MELAPLTCVPDRRPGRVASTRRPAVPAGSPSAHGTGIVDASRDRRAPGARFCRAGKHVMIVAPPHPVKVEHIAVTTSQVPPLPPGPRPRLVPARPGSPMRCSTSSRPRCCSCPRQAPVRRSASCRSGRCSVPGSTVRIARRGHISPARCRRAHRPSARSGLCRKAPRPSRCLNSRGPWSSPSRWPSRDRWDSRRQVWRRP